MTLDDETSPLIDRVAATLRTPAPLSAGFDARVMAAVRASGPLGLTGRVALWLREPRPVFISPLAGLSLAAGIAVLVIAAGFALATHPRATVVASSSPQSPAPSPVQFVLVAPSARSVGLAGDFNGWDASHTPLARAASGLWTVDVPLAPGRYTYVFVVDGRRFVPDPAAPRAVGDDFGTPSSVVTVQTGGRS